jgi:tetratricopeptide (TPR) repeat protein
MWETCEIDVDFFNLPIFVPLPYGGGLTHYYTELWFKSKITGGENVGRVVAKSGKDELKRGELRIDRNAKGEAEIHTINETPWRQKLLASLFKELVDDGWEPAGKGRYWYSFRFRRSSSSELVSKIITLGNESLDRGEIRKAIEYYEKGLKIAQDTNNRRSEGRALGSLGFAYSSLREVMKAIDYYEKALKIAQEIGDRSNESPLLICLGGDYQNLGDVKKAIDYYEKALNIAQEIGDRRRESASIGSLGSAYSSLGDLKKAIDYYEKALNIAEEIGDRGVESHLIGSLVSSQLSRVG